MVKALIILILAAVIFGTTYHYVDRLYLAPARALTAEKERGPEPAPPDPALPEFFACVAVKKQGDLLAARKAFEAFVDHYPHSSKLDEARDLLGEINADILLSQQPAPEKLIYLVQPNDVLTRVAMRTHSTPELLMRSNNLNGIMLRIGQKLVVQSVDFSVFISMKEQRVRLYNGKRFFKQYHIVAMPSGHSAKKGAAAPPALKLTGRVVDKIATDATGVRVNFTDKGYAGATHKISFSIPGHSLYTVPPASADGKPAPGQSGIGLSADDMGEISVLLTKNNPVTIE